MGYVIVKKCRKQCNRWKGQYMELFYADTQELSHDGMVIHADKQEKALEKWREWEAISGFVKKLIRVLSICAVSTMVVVIVVLLARTKFC